MARYSNVRLGPVLALLAAVLLTTATVAAQPYYNLECRGGAGTISYTSSTKSVTWAFIAPTSVNVLAPGECILSSSNRALTASEPHCLTQRNVDGFVVFPLSNLVGSRFSSNQAGWVNQFMGFSPSKVFTVTKPATGCWEVVTWRP